MARASIGANFDGFSNAVSHHPLLQENVLRDILVELSCRLFEAVVRGRTEGYGNSTGTPVQTGYARGQWYVEHGLPLTVASPKGEGDVFLDPSGEGAVNRGFAKIVSSTVVGVPVWFTNGAEYAVSLEWGHSQRQAPQGMVRLATASGQRALDDVVRKLLGKSAP
jgi:hypothetical protein